YQRLALRTPILPADSLVVAGTRFTFGADFYQPGATLEFQQTGPEMFLRWPSGDLSPLVPLDRDHYIDRAYWEPVNVTRGEGDVPISITYDRFTGTPAK
ncbi:MAG TPA: hypothetical protein VLJ83_09010, partial [Gemmatimonadaceae bacterium]|nr:hypothetical protein [Gemmatimonadaceae bacterium]